MMFSRRIYGNSLGYSDLSLWTLTVVCSQKRAILSYKYVFCMIHDFLFVFPVEEEQLFSELDDFSWLKRRKKRAVSL